MFAAEDDIVMNPIRWYSVLAVDLESRTYKSSCNDYNFRSYTIKTASRFLINPNHGQIKEKRDWYKATALTIR